jgi:hypothetical protein
MLRGFVGRHLFELENAALKGKRLHEFEFGRESLALIGTRHVRSLYGFSVLAADSGSRANNLATAKLSRRLLPAGKIINLHFAALGPVLLRNM